MYRGHSDSSANFSSNISRDKALKSVVLGGGCFWGVEHLLRQAPGVIDTDVGYCGGQTDQPTYKQICRGDTGHAEVVKVTYDPSSTSLAAILDLFFRLHDPTTRNRQGNDIGTQYRSLIVCNEADEISQAKEAVARAESKWKKPITTEVLAGPLQFWPAESEHQDYLVKWPNGYTCHWIREM
jgi:methionine-S-sulfoxide reductase